MGNIYIYGEIGWSVSAKDIAKQIDSIPKEEQINVFINSPGGDVYEGFAIFNALQRRKSNVSTYIDGLAYSAASWIALSANEDKRFMSKTSQFGIHKASTFADGNSTDLKNSIEKLSAIDQIQVEIYMTQTGLPESVIIDIMENDKPLSFKESLAFGFKSYEPEKIAAIFKLNNMDILEKLKSLGLAAKGEEVPDAIKTEAEKKVKEDAIKAATPADALTSELVKKQEFAAFQSSVGPFIDTMLEYVANAPTIKDVEEAAAKAASDAMIKILAAIKSDGKVPTPEEARLQEREEVAEVGSLKADNQEFKKLFKK